MTLVGTARSFIQVVLCAREFCLVNLNFECSDEFAQAIEKVAEAAMQVGIW